MSGPSEVVAAEPLAVASVRGRRRGRHGEVPDGTGSRSARRRQVFRARLAWSAAGTAALVTALAACGGGGGSSSGVSYGAGPTASSSPPATAVVAVRASRLGQILVDGQGRTLYLFEADKAGKSACDGGCAAAWPPYLSNGTPRASAGAATRLLGVSVRAGGRTQVTYAGHPLYYYAGDAGPGDVAGQGLDQFGAEWYVLAPSGGKLDTE